MSEHMLRPAVQRTEIGPLLSTAVPEILEIAEQIESRRETRDAVICMEEYTGTYDLEALRAMFELLNADMKHAVSAGMHNWFDQDDVRVAALDDVSYEFKRKTSKSVTYFSGAQTILIEGMESGVTMPLKLAMMIVKREHLELGAHNQEDFKHHLVAIMREQWFDDMLHTLAIGPNGSLGVWSTNNDFQYLVGRATSGDRSPYLIEKFLVQKSDGVWGLSVGYSERMKNKHSHKRQAEQGLEFASISAVSGGCPVRHARFKKIGAFASGAFEELGIDPATLNDPARKSSISLCREFVANRVEKIFEAAE